MKSTDVNCFMLFNLVVLYFGTMLNIIHAVKNASFHTSSELHIIVALVKASPTNKTDHPCKFDSVTNFRTCEIGYTSFWNETQIFTFIPLSKSILPIFP